jgi:phosphoserine/homoserine phosphotransferase
MKIVCLDLEGVLIPEFWIAFAKATKIPELRLTTRDVPDYDELMKMRMRILREHKIGIKKIHQVVKKMRPMPGAPKFIKWLRERAQPVIITGSYYDYIQPLIAQIGYPFTIANNLKISPSGEVIGYKLREADGKAEMVNRFRDAGYGTVAIGDSFNDLGMLECADHGILFKASPKLLAQEKNLPHAKNYAELKKILEKIL